MDDCETLPAYARPNLAWQTMNRSPFGFLEIEFYVQHNLWPDLPKGVLHTHHFKTHFSLPFDSYINGPTAHVFNTAEGGTICFQSSLFLEPVWHSKVLGWPSNGPIFPWQAESRLWFTTQLADAFGHGFSYFVWHLEVKMAPMEVIWLFLVKT